MFKVWKCRLGLARRVYAKSYFGLNNIIAAKFLLVCGSPEAKSYQIS